MALTTPLFKQLLTESALTLLIEAKRSSGTGLAAGRRPRILTSPLGPVDPVVVQRQASLLRYVSITEAYVDALLADLLLQRLGTPTTLLRSMVHEIELAASGSWSKRLESFRRIHSIRLATCDSWKEVDAATHARNSIAHGLGRLTASQRQNPNFAAVVGKVGIGVSGGTMLVTNQAIDSVYNACREFIRSIDAAT